MRATILVVLAGCGFEVAGSQPRDAAIGGDGRAIDAPTVLGDAPIDASIDTFISPDLVLEAEAADQLTMPQTHTWVTRTSVNGFSGTAYMELIGSNGSPCPNGTQVTIATCAAAMFYDVTVIQAGTYTFWIRMWADGSASDSVYATIDDMTAAAAQAVDVIEDQTWRWSKSAAVSTYTLTAGAHRLGIWHREGGARVDRLALMSGLNPPP